MLNESKEIYEKLVINSVTRRNIIRCVGFEIIKKFKYEVFVLLQNNWQNNYFLEVEIYLFERVSVTFANKNPVGFVKLQFHLE